MTRGQLQNRLVMLGCKKLCNDNKTLVVYNMLQNWLYYNKCCMKAITKIWLNNNEICICLYENYYFNTGFIVE